MHYVHAFTQANILNNDHFFSFFNNDEHLCLRFTIISCLLDLNVMSTSLYTLK